MPVSKDENSSFPYQNISREESNQQNHIGHDWWANEWKIRESSKMIGAKARGKRAKVREKQRR